MNNELEQALTTFPTKSLDIAAHVANWMRNRNTVEYLGIWEQLNNPNFKPLEFEGFKKQARN